MLTVLPACSIAQSLVKKIETRPLGQGVEMTILGTDLAKPQEILAFGGKSYILQFKAGLSGRADKWNVRKNGVQTVQLVWFGSKTPSARVHVRLAAATKTELLPVEGGWRVLFGNTRIVAKLTNPILAAAQMDSAAMAYDGTDFVPTPPKPPTTLAQPAKKAPVKQSTKVSNSGTMPVAPTVSVSGPLAPKGSGLVSLDFVNTEIVQVLKALALQAKVNIVTAPDMKGSITVALDRVTLTEALDFVTSLAGLRYAKVGNTFVVAPKDQFGEIMRSVNKSSDEISETRIVPVYSGETSQIKAAVLKAFPADSGRGSFDMLLPNDSGQAEKAPAKADAKEGDAPKTETKSPSSTRNPLSELYVMLVGNKAVLDQVEPLVRLVDKRICEAYGITVPADASLIQETYLLQSDTMSAKSLIDVVNNLGGTAFRNVELYPSPEKSDRQAVLLVGRTNEVDRARKMLQEFDATGDDVAIYDVKYLDPRALREEIVSHVPGLRATVPPGSAANTRLYQPGAAKSASEEGAAGAAGGRAVDAAVKGDRGLVQGLEQPFTDLERTAQPLKLILRGSKAQIERALSHLAMIDVAPKQIALDMRVMEMTKEDALRIGLDWSIFTGGFVKTLSVNQGLGDTGATPGTIEGDFSNGNFSGGVLGTLDQIANSRKLLARPNMLAIDGRETEIFVGDVVRYIESIQSTQTGVTVTTNSIRIGVRFAVMARAGADGNLIMDLRPVTSYLRGFTPVPGGGQLPQTSERIVQSTLTMKSGETIALGGLIRDEDRKIVSGIPLLKDIPIIGKLFSRTDNVKNRTEVVFFLTARLVDDKDRQNSAVPQMNEKLNPSPLDQIKKEQAEKAKDK